MMSDERDNAALEQSEPLAGALATDGARWRVERSAHVDMIERRLRASLQVRGGESGGLQVSALRDGDELSTVTMTVERTDLPDDTGAPNPSRQRWFVRANGARRPPAWVAIVAAVLLVGAFGSLIALHSGIMTPGGQSQTPRSYPPPLFMRWSSEAAAGSADPQQAFAAGMRLTPCMHGSRDVWQEGLPPNTTTVTWLFTRQNFGIANMQVTCQNQARPVWLWALGLSRNAHGVWGPPTGFIYPNQNPFHSEPDAVPAWLNLPPGAYDREEVFEPYVAVPEDPPTASVVVWLSQTHMYYLGHVSAGEPHADGAVVIKVNGLLGWVVQQNGIVTVTLPLVGGTTAFFSGTGTLAEIEALAPVAFAHMNEALQPLLPVGDGLTPSP